MKQYRLLLFAIILISATARAQSIIDLFKMVQAYSPSYIGDTIPDYIFNRGAYYPASNDSLESEVYELDSLDLKRNYLE